ncbi:MAG: hypothetical protein D6720_02330 [Gammaproteobacteria bacterium]|nr:MAG: hypothetical protein D6720_02330 [Gammaproteobacteria bacterium]
MAEPSFPRISRAIPVRRYQYGDFQVTVLDEVESPDPVAYRYLMAFVREGQSQPTAFVSCEPAGEAMRAEGRYQLRVINRSMDEPVMADDALGGLDTFCGQALEIAEQLYSLQDEEPYRLA